MELKVSEILFVCRKKYKHPTDSCEHLEDSRAINNQLEVNKTCQISHYRSKLRLIGLLDKAKK